MGTLKIKGVNILDYSPCVSINDIGLEHEMGQKIHGISAEIDGRSQKIVKGWNLGNADGYSTNSSYDACCGKVKVNGQVAPVMIDGTRPINNGVRAQVTGTGLTHYLNNVNGMLYLADNANTASGTFVVSSKAPNKDCVVNMVCWGSGGKGGTGAHWFMSSNNGGIGGAGGGKVFFTACIKNGDYLRLVTESDTVKTGRVSESNDTTFASPNLYVYNSVGEILITCEGGRSGTANNQRSSTDDYLGGGIVIVAKGANCPIIVRKKVNGANKIQNGLTGRISVFQDANSPCLGNLENIQGSLVLSGSGGKGPDTSFNLAHGSGGAGGYGTGGNAGDTGVGSQGSAGTNGAGGGGAGTPSGGASGGEGGLPGFIIFY